MDLTHQWRELSAQSNLTQSQLLIWAGQQLSPDTPLYNMVLTWTISGSLDPDRFRRTFQMLIDRCDALRIVVDEVDGIPRMRTLPRLSYEMELVDLSQEVDPEAAYGRWLADRVQHCFDLTSHLFDSVLIKLADERFVWYLNQHHLITDGVAVALVYRHVAALYSEAEAKPPSLPTFQAYAEHERSVRESAAFRKAREYWQTKLAEAVDPVRFYGRSAAEPSAQTRRVTCALGAERTRRILALAEQPGIRTFTRDLTLNQIFATLLFVYLHRVGDQDRLRIGTPIHNRPTASFKETVGVFIEICPLQLEIEGEETFLSLLRKVAGEMQEVLLHAQPGVTSALSNRSYNVLLNFVNASFEPFHGYPTRSEWVHAGFGDSNHHLRLQVHDLDEAENFVLHFDLNAELFNEEAQGWVVRHFLTVLDAFLEDPAQPIGGFDLLAADERAKLLRSFNQTDALLPQEATVIQLFEQQVERTPDRIAVVDGSRELSYRTLSEQANRLAHCLRAQGVGPDVFVGLCTHRSAETLVGLLAVLKAGGAYVPLDPSYPEERLAQMLHATGAPVLLTQQSLRSRFPDPGATIISLDDEGDGPAHYPATDPPPVAARPDLAYAMFTSGSTGQPKGVLISHASLLNYVWWARRTYCGDESLVFPLFSSLSFDLTVTSIFVPLISGGGIVVYGEDEEMAQPAILRVFAEDRVDIVKLTPAHLSLLSETASVPRRLRKMIVGGEDFKTHLALAAHRLLGAQVEIYNEYGPTETTVGCMVHRYDPGRDTLPSVPIGVPADNTRVYLLDRYGQPAPPGLVGELFVSGAGVARGYLKRPDLTAERFRPDPFQPGAKMYSTGDLARWRSDGELEFLGRADGQVKIRGHRVELGEVEAHLLEHPSVRGCAVVAVEPAHSDEAEQRPDSIAYCVRCGLPSNYPDAEFDGRGVCRLCRTYDQYRPAVDAYFDDMEALRALASQMRAQRAGAYDCVALFSGGKDSTYMLYRLVEMGLRPLVFTLDNGYISDQAKENIQRVVDHLGVDHVYGSTPYMDTIFTDSLQRFSNVCDGCFKTIYTLSMNLAHERGIRYIVTGLARGQLFETRLGDLFAQRVFDRTEVDRTVLEARKAYHRMDDVISRCLDTGIFRDDATFEQIQFVDFYRYCDAKLDEMLAYLRTHAPWIRPGDTGRSTNCRINDVGIYVHKKKKGYHNYALPYSWDVRLGHKERHAALEELDDALDKERIQQILNQIGYTDPDDRREKSLAAYYRADEALSASDLRTFLEARLPSFMVPAFFIPLDEIPLNRNGKVDRAALPDPWRSRRRAADFAAARTDQEKILARIWAEVFRIDSVGIHDNFFDLGGDSIIGIQIVARANQAGLRLVPRQIFECQTVARLAAVAGQGHHLQAEQGLVTGELPLTPIQHWFFAQDPPNPNQWSQSLLLELPAGLNRVHLERALNYLPVHHDALRLRFTRSEAGWRQSIPSSALPATFRSVDLSGRSEPDQRTAVESVQAALLETLDIARGRLLAAAIFERSNGTPDWLLLVIHHLAVDGVSWLPILQDLETIYTQIDQNAPIQLSPKTTSYRQWAELLNHHAQSEAQRAELPYWLSLAEQIGAAPPTHPRPGPDIRAEETRSVRVTLEPELTDALLHLVPSAGSTQVNDLLLTALARMLAARTGSLTHLVDIEGHGREEIVDGLDLSRTVGWFTTVAPVVLRLPRQDDPGEQIRAIKEQLRRLPNRGIGYGLLRFLCRDRAVARQMESLPQPEILFNYLGQFDQMTAPRASFRLARELTDATSPRNRRPYRLEVSAFVMGGTLSVDFGFRPTLDRPHTVSALADDFITALTRLIEHCLNADSSAYTPSDFPLAGLNQQQLDQISGLLQQLER